MPDVGPFRGIRYSAAERLRDLVCPPYDVISSEEQRSLYERDPHNAVRLELSRSGADGYAEVAATFRRWLDEGVLVRDERPSMYVYRQDFVGPDGARRRVAGVLGALSLEEFGDDSGVLPHERTMEGPKADRLALLRACPVNISPIYAIYRGGGDLAPYLDSLESRPPTARFQDERQVLHRLWVVDGEAETGVLADALRAGPLVIADGHHRYETALAYHRERSGRPGGHDAILCYCVDADTEQLVVLPYHRALKTTASAEELAARLADLGATPVDDASAALAKSGADHAFAWELPDRRLLVEMSDDDVAARTGARARAWRNLDVVALHEALLPELGVDVTDMRFSRDEPEISSLVRDEGWSAGVLLRAVAPTEVVDVARSGERMPQKASYFWPKAVTGLVFRTLR